MRSNHSQAGQAAGGAPMHDAGGGHPLHSGCAGPPLRDASGTNGGEVKRPPVVDASCAAEVYSRRLSAAYTPPPLAMVWIVPVLLVVWWLEGRPLLNWPMGAWAAALTLAYAGRYLIARAFLRLRHRKSPDDERGWMLALCASLALCAAAWSALFWSTAPSLSSAPKVEQALLNPPLSVAMVLMAVVAAAQGSLSAMPIAYAVFTITMLVPVAVWLLLFGPAAGVALGFVLLFYLLVMNLLAVRNCRQLSRQLAAEWGQAIERDALAQALQALSYSDARFRQLTAISSDWYWERDAELRFTHIWSNPNLRPELARANAIGKLHWEDPGTGIIGQTWEAHRSTLKARAAFHDLLLTRTLADGSIVYISASGEPFFDAAGNFAGYRGVAKDVTGRRHQELQIQELNQTLEQRVAARTSALTASEARFHALFERAPVGIAVITAGGMVADVNQELLKLLGYRREQMVGQHMGPFVHPNDWPALADLAEQFDAGRLRHHAGGRRYLRQDGTVMTANVVSQVVNDDSGKHAYRIVTVEDTSARVKVDQERAALAAIVAASDDDIISHETDGTITSWNEGAVRLFGYPAAEALGRNVSLIATAEGEYRSPQISKRLPAWHEGQLPAPYETLRRAKNGREIDVQVSLTAIRDAQGEVLWFAHIYRNITKRIRADQRLRAYARQVSELSGRLLAAQEEERRHIARELHDEIGQVLTAVRLALIPLPRARPGEAERVRAAEGDPLIAARLEVEHAIARVRNLSMELRPPALDDLGLLAALRALADLHSKRTRMRAAVDAQCEESAIPKVWFEVLYRVCQESLTNVARHSQAQQVQICLSAPGGNIALRVRDDGVGFNTEEEKPEPHFGIIGMRERVRLYGGTLEVISAPGKGTEVLLQIPLDVTLL